MRGSEVFVGGLPPTITENAIRELLSQCGEILEIRLIKDRIGNLKGFCFVRFATKEAAEKAVKEKSGVVVDGKKIGVLPSTEQDTLYFGNLNKGWNVDEFEGIVRQVFPDVVSVELATLSGEIQSGKKRNRGFAFVKFSSHAAAARALRVGSKPEFMLGNLHPAVQWAEEQPETDPAVLSKIKIAFIRNLPTSADENYLKKLFDPFGEIEKVVLWKKGSSPVGFVHFSKRSDLENAIRWMHEKVVESPKGGPTYKLSVEIARPTEKSKKRNREDSGSNLANKIPNHLENSSSVKSESSLFSALTPSAQKEMEYDDPYEAAVMSLPVSVKERLLRIMRLHIATRFDIDIQNIISLRQLPESTAISVLDQFMLSGADAKDKGIYLAGLISKHKAEQLGVSYPHGGGLSRVGNFASSDVVVSSFPERDLYAPKDTFGLPVGSTRASFTSRGQLQALDSLASHAQLSESRSDKYVPRHSAVMSSAYPTPMLSRASLGRREETSCSPLHPTSTYYAPYKRHNFSPLMNDVSGPGVPRTLAPFKADDVAAESPLTRFQGRYGDMVDRPATRAPVRFDDMSSHLPTRIPVRHEEMGELDHPRPLPTQPRVRFDPFTGEPYKFDPYTGERILPLPDDTSPHRNF